MKRIGTTYIIGCFLVLAFLLNGILPDVLMVSGHLMNKATTAALADQEDMNTERGTEETKGPVRTEYLADNHPYLLMLAPSSLLLSNRIIPHNIAFTQAGFLTIATPPPDQWTFSAI
jgi:hypothetical protein